MAEIAFDSGSTQYCIVEPLVLPADLYEHVILPEWGLQAPNLVLSVMGGAGNMQLDARFDSDSFSKGLVEAALRTGAWVITGGTKSGVMEMVGKAMKEHDKQRQVPCLGISALGGLTSKWREVVVRGACGMKVDAAKAKKEPDAKPETDGKIPLAEIEDNHTHSVLVDSGVVGGKAFGTESTFRAEFESYIVSARHDGRLRTQSSSRNLLQQGTRRSSSHVESFPSEPDLTTNGKASQAPRVMILVNGGKISLQALLEAIGKGCPIVLCEGSGRLSDLLCTILQGVWEHPDCDFRALCEHAKSLHMKTEELTDKEVDMAERIIKSGAVEIYTISERLEDVILRAVLEGPDNRRCNVNVKSQLMLAVQWGCTDYFDMLGRKLVQECGGERDGPAKAIEFIFKYIVNGVIATKVKDRGAENKSRADIVAWLLKNHRKQMEEFKAEEGLQKIEWCHLSGGTQSLEGLLLWSIEHEAPQSVLEVIWNHMEDPVHAALIAASCCRETAARGHSSSSCNDTLVHRSLSITADRFERLAVLVLEDLAKTGKGVEYLFQESSRWTCGTAGDQKCTTCFRLAHSLGCKKFVAATFYSLAVDTYWMTPSPFNVKGRRLDPKYVSFRRMLSLLVNPAESEFTIWELLSIPAIKMYTHGFARLIFVTIYSYAVFYGRLTRTGVQPMEVVLFLWGLGLAQVEVGQIQAQNSFWVYIRDFWNFLDCLYITLMMSTLVLGLFLSDSDPDTSSTEHVLEIIHALCLLPSWIRVLQLLQLSRYFGTLLMTICGMVKDALRFFIMVGIFCFAFSCALTPILFVSASDREDHGLLWAFWMIVGDSGGLDKAREKVAEQKTLFMRCLTQLLLYTLALVSNVLLVNLLIAVMNSTYEQNQVASQTEWAFYHINAVLEFEGEQKLPPPLNLLERFLPDSYKEEEPHHRTLTRCRTFDFPINKRDLKDSQQRAIVAVGLEEDVGEAAMLRAENADLRRRNAELAGRNHDLERMAANYLLQEGGGTSSGSASAVLGTMVRRKTSEKDIPNHQSNSVVS